MQSFLIDFSETHRLLAYLIIFIGILIEGEILLVLAGVLSRNGYLDFFNIIVFAFVAAIIHDLIYWYIGKKISETKKEKFLFFKINKINYFLERLRAGMVSIFLSQNSPGI